MTNIRAYRITVEAPAGAGTATSAQPLCGEIVEVRLPAAGTVIADGTADFTLTRVYDGSTVLAAANQAAPWEFYPRRGVHSNAGGTTAYSLGVGPVYDGSGIPIDGYLQVVVAQGPIAGGTADVYVHIRED